MPRGINTREKGRRKELQVRDILTAQGYDVQMSPTPTRWARQTDLWGFWDLVAVGQHDIRFIQVKTNLGDAKKDWKQKAKAWKCPPESRKELWVMADRKEPRIIQL